MVGEVFNQAENRVFSCLGRFQQLRLVADWSWEASLDEADKLRLKLSVSNRYDSTPQGSPKRFVLFSSSTLQILNALSCPMGCYLTDFRSW